ncbi:MAG: hypothetical protein CL832_01865 [Crocinitomicaceae bacterium]|nr:hypothetical protein [Crocinitomicaceae bacterium]|tara:strand:+ start:1122 stop:1496 length:375 start_codon:yes stop_codon:yes gene_type:complete
MFNKGNNYGKGRPKGSQNKLTTKTKDFLKELLFDENKFLEDYAELDTNQRMELRIKLAPYILPKPSVSEDIQRDLPLFIDEPPAVNIYKKFGLNPEKLKNPHEFDFREWCKHMREKSEREEKLT